MWGAPEIQFFLWSQSSKVSKNAKKSIGFLKDLRYILNSLWGIFLQFYPKFSLFWFFTWVNNSNLTVTGCNQPPKMSCNICNMYDYSVVFIIYFTLSDLLCKTIHFLAKGHKISASLYLTKLWNFDCLNGPDYWVCLGYYWSLGRYINCLGT